MFKARLFSGLAVGTSVAAVASFTALAGTAHASGILVGDTSGDVTATGTGTSTTWAMTVGAESQAATVQVRIPPERLSSTAPTFTVTSGTAVEPGSSAGSGQPRWVIALDNGCEIEGGVATGTNAAGATGSWTAYDEGGTAVSTLNTSWSTALTAAGGTTAAGAGPCDNNGGTGSKVGSAIVTANGPANAEYTVTNVTLNGLPVVHEDQVPILSESATGRISNFATGKCLDVRNGIYRVGATLQQWTCGAMGSGVAGGNQNFRIVDLDNGESYLVARSASGALWGVDSAGAGKPLTLVWLRDENQMTKQGAFYHFPSDEVDMTALGSTNGGGVIGLARVPDNSQRWHNPEP